MYILWVYILFLKISQEEVIAFNRLSGLGRVEKWKLPYDSTDIAVSVIVRAKTIALNENTISE